jgi:hypothetical protein
LVVRQTTQQKEAWLAREILKILVIEPGGVKIERRGSGHEHIAYSVPKKSHYWEGGKDMALSDPVAVYDAENNVEANLLCSILNEAGIEAYPTEDVTQAGTWVGGIAPEGQKPQVWVERANVDQAVPILEQFDKELAERRRAEQASGANVVEVTCEECGEKNSFPGALEGSVQSCSKCGAYLDVVVGEVPDGDYGEPEGEDPAKGEVAT